MKRLLTFAWSVEHARMTAEPSLMKVAKVVAATFASILAIAVLFGVEPLYLFALTICIGLYADDWLRCRPCSFWSRFKPGNLAFFLASVLVAPLGAVLFAMLICSFTGNGAVCLDGLLAFQNARAVYDVGAVLVGALLGIASSDQVLYPLTHLCGYNAIDTDDGVVLTPSQA